MKEKQTAKNRVDLIAKSVEELGFNEKMELLRRVFGQKSYRNEFYKYTEGLAAKYGIQPMTPEELDEFLHAK